MRLWLVAVAACGGSTAASVPSNVSAVGASIDVTWMVHPPVPNPENPTGAPMSPLTLVIDGEHIELEPQIGSLDPDRQTVCRGIAMQAGAGLARDDVAKIAFFEAVMGGYVVKRTADALVVMSWQYAHGVECPDDHGFHPCEDLVTEVRRRAAPRDVPVVQRIVYVDGSGGQTPYDCSARR